jgi:glycosyltransferase involved in cell wall biosynthesis
MLEQQIIDFSLIIPCYNEGEMLERNVREIYELLNLTKLNYEIIFIDDKSKDNTLTVIQRIIENSPNMKLRSYERNIRRGRSVSDGIKAARGKVIGFIDIDLEVSCAYIPYFIAMVNKGFHVAVGRRIYKFSIRSIDRWLASKGYNWLVRKLLKVSLRDTEAGYKFFNREKILPILERIKEPHWFWDTEIMVESYYQGLRITEIPVLFVRSFERKSSIFKMTSIIQRFLIRPDMAFYSLEFGD